MWTRNTVSSKGMIVSSGLVLTGVPTSEEIRIYDEGVAVGSLHWGMSHDLADGRIQESDAVNSYIARLEQRLRDLAESLKPFGVIPPSDYPERVNDELPPPPDGKMYFVDWYQLMDTRPR